MFSFFNGVLCLFLCCEFVLRVYVSRVFLSSKVS